MRAKGAKAIRQAGKRKKPLPQDVSANRRMLIFTRKFLVVAVVMVVFLSLVPEVWFEPMNRFTALLVGEVLRAWRLQPVVQNSGISIHGFRVNVIAECSAIHLVALLLAFIYAFPANRREKWIGAAAGTSLLFFVNILRIALVVVIGFYFPNRFEAAHIYFGQLAMLAATITACLVWCRWIQLPERMEGPSGFLARFLLFSSVLFLLWVPLNKLYIAVIDHFIQWMFGLADLQLVIPRSHALYYQAFSVIAMLGLLLAVRDVNLNIRVCCMVIGTAVLSLLQLAFRLCNIWITAFEIGWVLPVYQVVYNFCVYAVPIGVTLWLLMHVRTQRNAVA